MLCHSLIVGCMPSDFVRVSQARHRTPTRHLRCDKALGHATYERPARSPRAQCIAVEISKKVLTPYTTSSNGKKMAKFVRRALMKIFFQRILYIEGVSLRKCERPGDVAPRAATTDSAGRPASEPVPGTALPPQGAPRETEPRNPWAGANRSDAGCIGRQSCRLLPFDS